MLMDIFEKRGEKYDKMAIRILLVWCKKYDFSVTAKKVFSVQTWQSVGKVLFEAALRGDKIATASLTAWRLILDSLGQSDEINPTLTMLINPLP